MYKTELNCNPTRHITTKQEAVSHYCIISKMNAGEHNTYQEKKLETKVWMSFPYSENKYHKIIYMVKPVLNFLTLACSISLVISQTLLVTIFIPGI